MNLTDENEAVRDGHTVLTMVHTV